MLPSRQSDASTAASAALPESAPGGWEAAPRLLVAAALLAGLSALALFVDMPLARTVNAWRLPGELARFVRLGEVFAWGGTVGLIILAAAVLDPRGWRIVPRLVICAYGAGLAADAIKLLIGRTRPLAANLEGNVLETFAVWLPAWRAESLGLVHDHRLQSFPSGHAATAAGLAVALAALYPRGRWLFAGLAVLASVQRIEASAHFLSDVLAGAALGCLAGAICNARWGLRPWLTRIGAA